MNYVIANIADMESITIHIRINNSKLVLKTVSKIAHTIVGTMVCTINVI